MMWLLIYEWLMFVFVLCFRGGTRLKLLEYMAAGKVIVSTKKGAEGIPHKGLIAEIDERILHMMN